jgi:phosphoribosylglycinamide formyltransferase-1
VHPSLLPKYAGGMDTNVHEGVLKNGDTETGCTIHFVTDEVDGGPILIQKKCNVEPGETVDTLKIKVQKLEGTAFIEAIQLIQNNSYVR